MEASEALKDAQKNLQEVRQRGREVRTISRALREVRERNHLSEQIEDIIMRRGRLQ